MNTIQLAEETWFDHRKAGDTNKHEDGIRQKIAYIMLLLMMVKIKN
jgi:hypothetical protein